MRAWDAGDHGFVLLRIHEPWTLRPLITHHSSLITQTVDNDATIDFWGAGVVHARRGGCVAPSG